MSNKPSKYGKQYSPINKHKYKGKYPIQVRSSYEDKFCKWCDTNSQVLIWSSEPIGISYFDPIKQKNRRYFIDFLIVVSDKNTGKRVTYAIEIKPYIQCVPPVITKGKSKKTRIHEAKTFSTNTAKWKAAIKYCSLKQWKFKLITERELKL